MPPLFRQQAVDAQQHRLTGDVILTQPLTLSLTVSLIVLCTTIIALWSYHSQYTRKETVQGLLQPDKGIIKVYADQRGVITELNIKEGDRVIAGQVIARIFNQNPKVEGKNLRDKQVFFIQQQLALLSHDITQTHQQESAENERLQLLQEKLSRRIVSFENVRKILSEKRRLMQKRQEKLSQLEQHGHISNDAKQEFQQRLLQVLQEVEQNASAIRNSLDELALSKHQYAQINTTFTVKRRDFARQKVLLKKQLTEIQASIDDDIIAHQSGIVTAIHHRTGSTIKANQAILTIVPEGARLIAEILLPTRSAGFIKKGINAKLRFDAFPHQRFGFVNSRIIHVEKTVITQVDNRLPITIQEPMYRVRAVLDQQAISAFGEKFPLKSGMLFQADISLDSRTLLDWLFDPIYSLKGNLT